MATKKDKENVKKAKLQPIILTNVREKRFRLLAERHGFISHKGKIEYTKTIDYFMKIAEDNPELFKAGANPEQNVLNDLIAQQGNIIQELDSKSVKQLDLVNNSINELNGKLDIVIQQLAKKDKDLAKALVKEDRPEDILFPEANNNE